MAAELDVLRAENARLKAYIASMDAIETLNIAHQATNSPQPTDARVHPWDGVGHGLSKEQVARYSRQIILPSFGVRAQSRVCYGSVLIIGAGGLGSPAAIYLAAAGVGRLGLVDKDSVELSNIHRQIIHTEASVGTHKADSAAAALRSLNSSIKIETYKEGFTPNNAVQLVSGYDVILDASDNAPTRYLISDACCTAKKPLVSGAAIGTDGQLTVYCYGDDGPCYRCLFPTAPLPQSCSRCVDAGVLGAVPGVVGTMQALEAIKILSGVGEPMSRKLLVLDSLSSRFHVMKLRAKSAACVACGEKPQITADNLKDYDYAAFTGQESNDGPPKPLQLIDRSERLTPSELHAKLLASSGAEALVVDVRPPEQFAICHLPGAINAPWKTFDKHVEGIKERLRLDTELPPPLFVVCRRGNDSQRAVARLRELGIAQAVDVVGGMEAWGNDIDSTFPVY